MMGKKDRQMKMFSITNPEQRVPEEHELRKVRRLIDFSFVRDSVKQFYGYNGNVSVDPEVIVKMMFLLFFYDVKSERELMKQIGYRMDFMWFLDYELDDEIPDHSVLSKARKRWGLDIFREIFVETIVQCVNAGLVEGSKIHMDSSLVDADCSKDSVLKGSPELISRLKTVYKQQEKKFEEQPKTISAEYREKVSDNLLSTTDPDAVVVKRKGKPPRPRYKVHRAIDDKQGVITATQTTRADVDEGLKLIPLVEEHEKNTGHTAETAIGDSGYGTADNFRECNKRGIRAHMSDLSAKNGKHNYKGIFGPEKFKYDAETDTYICPAGQKLTRRKHKSKRKAWEYTAGTKICKSCELKSKCTKGKSRTVKRHEDHEAIEQARKESASYMARRDRARRKHLMEGSFADSVNNHHFSRSRWRRLWRQQIQDYLIAAVQNIKILINRSNSPGLVAKAAKKTGLNCDKWYYKGYEVQFFVFNFA